VKNIAPPEPSQGLYSAASTTKTKQLHANSATALPTTRCWGLWPAQRCWHAAYRDTSSGRCKFTRIAYTPAAIHSFFRGLQAAPRTLAVAPQTSGIIDIEQGALDSNTPLWIIPKGLASLCAQYLHRHSADQCALICAGLPFDPVLGICLYNPLAVL
jgi:hypothetical protein